MSKMGQFYKLKFDIGEYRHIGNNFYCNGPCKRSLISIEDMSPTTKKHYLTTGHCGICYDEAKNKNVQFAPFEFERDVFTSVYHMFGAGDKKDASAKNDEEIESDNEDIEIDDLFGSDDDMLDSDTDFGDKVGSDED
jgi:hypothetical protein